MRNGARLPRLLTGLLVVALTACARPPAPVRPSLREHGNLVLLGGGDKPDDVVQLFVDLAGGATANIVVLPLASAEPRASGDELAALFTRHGAAAVTVLQIDDRQDALRPDTVRVLRAATGVFFGGGDQRRISERMVGTPALDAVREVKARGGVIGGTSAGATCQSRVMLTGDGNDASLAPHSMVVAPGTGLFEGVIVDSHFVVRRRFTRLQSVVLEHPDLLGVGIDESTATWVKPDGTMEVRGTGEVVVYDASHAHLAVGDAEPVVSGLETYTLKNGARFDLHGRRALP